MPAPIKPSLSTDSSQRAHSPHTRRRRPQHHGERRIERVVRGESPFYIRLIIGVLRVWFYIYDLLNWLPYQLFNSPGAKLAKSVRIKVSVLCWT
jgi:hypothetical protein